jgi:cellulose biosynthesis protein BcsQ
MAVSNVGACLALRGHRVVLLDVDFEQPSLLGYFRPNDKHSMSGASAGFRDLLVAYQAAVSSPMVGDEPLALPDVRDYLVQTGWSSRTGETSSLSVIPASATHEDSEAAEHAFGWEAFWHDWDGAGFIEWFRRRLREIADIVLIDLPSGANVGNALLNENVGDLAVVFCATTTRSLTEATRWAQSLSRPNVIERRAGRSLGVLAVPAQLDYG